MRVYLTSDLHLGLDARGDRSSAKLAEYIVSVGEKGDVLLLLGDQGDSITSIRRCLGLFQGFRGKKLVVKGNHDIWVDKGENSLTRYHELSRISQQSGFWPLDDCPTVVNGLGVVGVMGWYDYSFRDEELEIPHEYYRTKTPPGAGIAIWGDERRVKLGMTDEEATEWQVQLLHQHIQALPAGIPFLVGMHHVPTKALLAHPRWLVPPRWRFANAFLGSSRFRRLLSEYAGRIVLVACGHIHSNKTINLQGVVYTSVGSDYRAKELLIYDPAEGSMVRKMF